MLIIGEVGRDGKEIYRSFTSFASSYYSYCSWGSKGKNTEVVCHSLLQWTTFCQTSPPWRVHRGWPHMAWLSFIESDKLWFMWSDWLVVCDCGFRNQKSNCQHLLDHQKSKRVPEKHLFMLYWLCQSLWLCGSL